MNNFPFSKTKAFCVSIFIWVAFSCQEKPILNEEKERAKILKIHNQQRENHFQKLLNESFEQFSNQFIMVNRGEIKKPTREEFLSKRKNYFETVAFEKWDDISPPIIRFSQDHTMAYTVVHKEVIITFLNKNSIRQRESTEFSWVAIYKKIESDWKIDCVVSTNKPSELTTFD